MFPLQIDVDEDTEYEEEEVPEGDEGQFGEVWKVISVKQMNQSAQ